MALRSASIALQRHWVHMAVKVAAESHPIAAAETSERAPISFCHLRVRSSPDLRGGS